MLDFRLYTFLTLSETLNYTKAADILCITQPAVSQHIKYMEKEYDCKLFFYDGKQLNLTAQGKLLAEKVRTMVADEKMIRSLLKQNQKTPALRFGATLTIGEFILPQRLNSFLAEHTETSLCMIVENTATLLQMLNSGDIGFAFDTTGIDFAMTALFTVIFVEQWLAAKQHGAVYIAIAAILISTALFQLSNFLLPALILLVILLVIFQDKVEKKEDVS